MGNQSDLQKQVKRFKARAADAETQVNRLQEYVNVMREENENLIIARAGLVQELQKARTVATALVGIYGPTVIPAEVIDRIDNGELVGVEFNSTDKGDVEVSPTFSEAASPVEEEADDGEE